VEEFMVRRLGLAAVICALCATTPSSLLAQRLAGDAASFAAYVASGYRTTANVTYGTASGTELKLDFYRPAEAAGPLPTAIFMHGGGYSPDAKKEASVPNVMPYLQMGWNAVNVEYRPSSVALAPAAVEDARCALRWVIHNAKEYNVDTGRIVVTGQSAGAHLALMTAFVPESAGFDRNCPGPEPLTVAAVVSWYGIFDYTALITDPSRTYASSWIGANNKEMAARVSPMTYVRPGVPPVIAIHGDADQTVPYEQEVRAVDMLKKVGVTAELVTIAGGTHGTFEREQVIRAWTAVEAFLVQNVVRKTVTTSAAR
jgi:acetyl esterase/lipase